MIRKLAPVFVLALAAIFAPNAAAGDFQVFVYKAGALVDNGTVVVYVFTGDTGGTQLIAPPPPVDGGVASFTTQNTAANRVIRLEFRSPDGGTTFLTIPRIHGAIGQKQIICVTLP